LIKKKKGSYRRDWVCYMRDKFSYKRGSVYYRRNRRSYKGRKKSYKRKNHLKISWKGPPRAQKSLSIA